MVTLTAAQQTALAEIVAAQEASRPTHLLTGYAGSGKTTLMKAVARHFMSRGQVVIVSAPTHKATAVLRARVGADMDCRTIQSLLSLQPAPKGAGTELIRARKPQTIADGVVIIDECSMISAELMGWIRDLLRYCFVLFVGDPAQLPPVGEGESPSFAIPSRSHLDTVVRQAHGNPILDAATAIRESQGGGADWRWVRDVRAGQSGLFIPKDVEAWLRKAFLSDAFTTDHDWCRYLCWTNQRADHVNRLIRGWRFGNATTPFVAGERVISRTPVSMDGEDGKKIVIVTNEEVLVFDIREAVFRHRVPACGDLPAWTTEIPSWEVTLLSATGEEVTAHMVRDTRAFDAADRRLTREAQAQRGRWAHRFAFVNSLLRLQAVYAMTVHTAQGSTFRNAFVDIGDIRRRETQNLLETQQLCYVAVTRATDMVFLVNTGA